MKRVIINISFKDVKNSVSSFERFAHKKIEKEMKRSGKKVGGGED